MVAVDFRGLDALSRKVRAAPGDLPIESVSLSLRDLIGYLHPPDEHLDHEDKQNRLRALKNRQNLFQEEVSFSGPWLLCCLLGKAVLAGHSLTPGALRPGAAGCCWAQGTQASESLQLLSCPLVFRELVRPLAKHTAFHCLLSAPATGACTTLLSLHLSCIEAGSLSV